MIQRAAALPEGELIPDEIKVLDFGSSPRSNLQGPHGLKVRSGREGEEGRGCFHSAGFCGKKGAEREKAGSREGSLQKGLDIEVVCSRTDNQEYCRLCPCCPPGRRVAGFLDSFLRLGSADGGLLLFLLLSPKRLAKMLTRSTSTSRLALSAGDKMFLSGNKIINPRDSLLNIDIFNRHSVTCVCCRAL